MQPAGDRADRWLSSLIPPDSQAALHTHVSCELTLNVSCNAGKRLGAKSSKANWNICIYTQWFVYRDFKQELQRFYGVYQKGIFN